MINATLVLEGGASRGIFTAGALDYVMEQNLELSHVIGVSMGACNGVDYVSKQIGRTKDCIIHDKEGIEFYFGPREMIRHKSVMNMDLLFHDFPSDIYPFDIDTYKESKAICEVVATNCYTGKATYFHNCEDMKILMQMCRASCSMPVIAPITEIEGIPYLDGGVADSIPLKRAMTYGNRKIVLILTRNFNYRKKAPKRPLSHLYKRVYKEYPYLVEALLTRHIRYNRVMEKIEEYEKKGYIYVLRPKLPMIPHMEKNKEKLDEFYQHGYLLMKEDYQNLLRYLDQ